MAKTRTRLRNAGVMEERLFTGMAPAARLVVSGSDAATFLQGQFTNDLRRMEPQPATYGLWLNQKGKVLADSYVLGRADGAFEVISLGSPASLIRERLEAYIIADDVVVEDCTAGCAGLLVAGAGAGDLLAELGVAPAFGGGFAEAGEGAVVFNVREGGIGSWFALGEAAAIATFRARFKAVTHIREAAAEEINFHRVKCGVPVVPSEIGPGDLPQEGDLDREAISFTKGCYLGQEVMSRLHNLGQVRRRLFIVRAKAGAAVPANFPASLPLFLAERRVGELRSFFRCGAEDALGMAMLSLNAVKPGDRLALSESGEPAIEVLALAEQRSAAPL